MDYYGRAVPAILRLETQMASNTETRAIATRPVSGSTQIARSRTIHLRMFAVRFAKNLAGLDSYDDRRPTMRQWFPNGREYADM